MMEDGITINKSVLILNLLWIINLASMNADATVIYTPQPDPWLNLEVHIDASTIPEGVTFNSDAQTLINQSKVPLYVVREVKQQEWIGLLPNTVLPKYKIVSNKQSQFNFKHGGWYSRGQSLDVFFALKSHDRRSLMGTQGPGRPHGIKPAEPMNLIFNAFYGSQKVVFEGRLSYRINKNYEKNNRGLWFEFNKLEISEDQLPPGVEIKQIEQRYNSSQRLKLEIYNRSDTPFYIVNEFDSPIDWLDILPNNVLPDYKLVSGDSFSLAYANYPHMKSVWKLNQNIPMLEITPRYIDKLTGSSFVLNNIKGDCRPEKIDIPAPVPFEIITFYGTNKHILSGNIIYKINPHYRPLAGSPKISSCDDFENASTGNDGTPIPSGRECEERLAGYGKRAKAICYDYINPGWRGPMMIVVPTGNEFNSNFAISKYEISVSDYSKYCSISKLCIPEGNKKKFNNPKTGISLDEAKTYAAWLSERTGKTYRLPTATEWEYAANAAGKQPKKDFNCRVVIDDEVIKGDGVVSIKSRQSNGWGLKNYIGNVQEWVVDEDKVMARGGSYTDPHDECDISLSRPHSGDADDITGFRLLLEMDVNYTSMNLPGINLSPQIFAAVQKNDLNMAKLLIQRGADLNIKDGRLGRTPLHYAQSKEMVDLLIKEKIDINVQDTTGRTPLYFMIENYDAVNPGLNNIIKLLLENGANSNIKNNDSETPIFVATRLDKVDIMELLAKSGADLNTENKGKLTPIFFAKSSEAVEVLSKYGEDLDYHTGNKRTVLYQSLRKKDPNIELIKTLLDSGADPNIHPENNSLLNSALYMRNEELIKALINHGVDPNMKDKSGKPILSKYLRHNKNLDSAEILLKYGANPNYLVIGKHTALSWALVFKWDDQAELLIKYGADVNANLDLDRKPLHIAIIDSTKIVKLLIDAGAKVNAVDNHNKTPLRLLCELGLGPKANPNMPQLTFEKLNNDNKNRVDNFKLLMKYDRSLKSIMGCKDKWDGIISYWDYIFSTRPFIMVPTKKYCGLSPIISDQNQDFISWSDLKSSSS